MAPAAARPAPMGLVERLRRVFHRMAESDEERLAEEVRAWASGIQGVTPIADAKPREQVKMAGVVRRITVRPVEGYESLEAVLSDGTGQVQVVWMGRRSIPGLTLGTRVVVDGMLADARSGPRMVNPRFEFSV